MLVKLAASASTATSKSILKQVGPWFEKHMGQAAHHIPSGVALTAGIAGADAITHAAFAKPGERKREAMKGLVQGTLYGAALSAIEPAVGDPLKKIFNFKH